jgi:hypothetical protein
MSRIVIVILIYHRHKPVGLIYRLDGNLFHPGFALLPRRRNQRGSPKCFLLHETD